MVTQRGCLVDQQCAGLFVFPGRSVDGRQIVVRLGQCRIVVDHPLENGLGASGVALAEQHHALEIPCLHTLLQFEIRSQHAVEVSDRAAHVAGGGQRSGSIQSLCGETQARQQEKGQRHRRPTENRQLQAHAVTPV